MKQDALVKQASRTYAPAVPRTTVLRWAIVAAGSLPFISWFLSILGARPGPLDAWFRFQCHGLIDRSLALGGRFFPVCSRCLGIYGGLLLAAVIARPKLEASARRVWLIAAAAVMVTEVYIQDRTGHAPYHPIRLMTGLLLAWPVVLTLLAVPAR